MGWPAEGYWQRRVAYWWWDVGHGGRGGKREKIEAYALHVEVNTRENQVNIEKPKSMLETPSQC